MKPIIEVQNLSKQYRLGTNRAAEYATLRESLTGALRAPFRRLGTKSDRDTFWALKDVSFTVAPGETVGIVGRNGAGKSTLLKVLSRITEPTAGRVALYGRVGSLLEVGTGFHPELTGRENIYLNGSILGMGRAEIERNFDEIVDFAEIERFLDTPVKHYSSGMYTRLAFSVAAHLQPEILIVDEVLAVGDAQFQKKCLGKMGEVARQGRTVLFVSHNMDAVRKLCTRGVMLERGEVKFVGTAEAVVRHYTEDDADAQATYEIHPPPASDDAPGEAYKLIIEDKDERPASAIPVGQPWQVRVHFRLRRRTEHFIIGLGFRTSNEVPLRTSWSDPQTLEPGEYQAVFREDTVILAPGRFTVIVGLSSHERTFHYADNAGALEIADYSEGTQFVRLHGVGILLNPLRTTIERIADGAVEAA